MHNQSTLPTIAVLMSTYNGAEFLEAQINSILEQTGVNVSLFVRDDGSSDTTPVLLNQFQEKGLLQWYQGTNLKSALSFMDLIAHAPDTSYYAFADQDDVWYENKLSEAIKIIRQHDQDNTPTLYFCKKRIVDQFLNPIPGKEDEHVGGVTLATSLLKSRSAGCTMVYNKSLQMALSAYKPARISMHDSWVLKVASAIGLVIYDERIFMDYRQHQSNVVGTSKSRLQTWRIRIRTIFNFERFKDDIRTFMAQELIDGYGSMMNEEDRYYCTQFAQIRKSFRARIRLLKGHYLKPHDASDQFAINLLVLLGLI